MATLTVLPEAAADLARLDDFLRPLNRSAADRALSVIDKGLVRLQRFPRLGRPLDDHPGYRELYLPFGAAAYVLRYRLIERAVVVVRIWHSREARR